MVKNETGTYILGSGKLGKNQTCGEGNRGLSVIFK